MARSPTAQVLLKGGSAGFRMTMEPAGSGRLVVSLVVLTALALLVRSTMEPGKYQRVTWLLLGFFALRVVLGWFRSRRIAAERPLHRRDDTDV